MIGLRFVDREAWDEAKDEGLGKRERFLQAYDTDDGWVDIPIVRMERKPGMGWWAVVPDARPRSVKT